VAYMRFSLRLRPILTHGVCAWWQRRTAASGGAKVRWPH